jgi:hypothetical protein
MSGRERGQNREDVDDPPAILDVHAARFPDLLQAITSSRVRRL